MNTSPLPDPSDLGLNIPTGPEAEQVARLEGELQKVKDARLQERFYFVTSLALTLSFLIMPHAPYPLILFAIAAESLLLLSLADRWGVEQIGDWVRIGVAMFNNHCAATIARHTGKDIQKKDD